MLGRVSWVIIGIMATTTAMGAAMVLPMIGAHRQALAEQPRVQSLVETVVAGEVEALGTHGVYKKISFGANDPGIALNVQNRLAIRDYAIEARQIADDKFRIQAWPRPKALAHGHAAAISYFVDLSASGKVLNRGWVGQDEAGE